jgi:hypothetical protein
MSFNAFQRELEKREIGDPKLRFILTLMYEQIAEVAKQGDQAAKVMLEMANSMEGIVGLHEETQRRLQQVARQGMEDGIDVSSVANEPEEN